MAPAPVFMAPMSAMNPSMFLSAGITPRSARAFGNSLAMASGERRLIFSKTPARPSVWSVADDISKPSCLATSAASFEGFRNDMTIWLTAVSYTHLTLPTN